MFNDTNQIKPPSQLRTLVASKKTGRFLELGTGAGISTSWILDGMDNDSTLVTVEQEESLHSIAKEHLANDSRVRFYTGDGGTFIEDTKENEVFDFIFADFQGSFIS